MAKEGHSSGYTLLELLIVLGILAVLYSWIPGFNTLISRERNFEVILELRRSLNFARAQAVNLQTRVTLCALNQRSECEREWQGREFATFIDKNRNYRLDEGEALRLGYWPPEQGQLTWRAALRRPYISFNPGGDTPQNGSFVGCRAGLAKAVVVAVNRAGRNYVAEHSRHQCQQ
jgi:prepilin-type N-terminal cleavage/methylation domain-containing protein